MFTTRRKGIIALLCAVFAAALIACAISLAPSASRTAPVYAAEGDVAAIGDTNYTSLKEAINAASTAETTVTLLADVDEDITVAADDNITIDLNGNTLTNVSGHTITNNGTLTITDSSAEHDGKVDNITNARAAVYNEVGATANLIDGTFTRSAEVGTSVDESGGNSFYVIQNFGTMVIGSESSTPTVCFPEGKGHFSSMIENGWYDGTTNTTQVKANLTINSGNFSGGINTIKNDDWGIMTINGGTFVNVTQNVVQNNNVLTINGGTFNDDNAVTYVLSSRYFNVIEGMNQGITTITDGDFTGQLYVSGASADYEISGGTFSEVVDADYIVEGSVFYPAEDGTYKAVTEEEFETVTDNAGVALMNGVVYDSLAEAVEAMPTGTATTITLVGNDDVIEGSGIIVPSGSNLTIDFNGKTYCVTSNLAGSPGYESQAFQLLRDSTIVLKNGAISGEHVDLQMYIQNYADLTLEDMTLDASDDNKIGYVISNNFGNTVITGDTTIVAASNKVAFDVYYWPSNGYTEGVSVTFDEDFIGSVTGKVQYGTDSTGAAEPDWQTNKANLAIENGEFDITFDVYSGDESDAGITVSGGEFSKEFDSAYVAEGSVLYTTDGDSFTVGTDDEAIDAGIAIIIDGIGYAEVPEGVVATVGAEGKVPAGYESLQDAITAAADGDTITLVRDITTTSYTVINDKDITIDLADFTITATGCDETYSSLLFIQGGSNVTIENGSLVGDFETSGINFDVIYLNSSNLTLNDVNISAAHDYMDGILFYGGMTNSDAVTAYNNKDFSNYYTLNVNNSTVVGYWYAIDGNAAGTHDGTIININNSTVTDATDVIGEPSGTAIFHPHFGILNVSGDDTLISGATGIEMRAGELNISGGNIVGNNEFMTSASGNGNSVFGAAVAVSQHTTNLLISVNVTGGTLETVGNAVYALYENDLMNDGDVDDITISVTGGTFNGEVYSEDVVDFISGGQFVVKPDDTYLAEGFSGFSEYNGMFVPVTSSTEGTMLEEIEQIRQEIADAIAEVNGALAGGDATTLAESMTKLIDRMNELEAMIGELDESMVTEADLAALRGSVTAAYTAAVSQVRAQLSAQIDDLREAIAGMGDVSAELEELRAAYEAADELLSADIADVSAELEAAISELESAYGEADDAIWNAIYALRDADSGMTTALWVIGVIAVLALCAGVAGVAFAIVRTKRS